MIWGEEKSAWSGLMVWICLGVALFFVFVYLRQRGAGGMGNFLAFRNTRARLLPDAAKVTFADVAGCDDAKLLFGDVVDYLRNPKRWSEAGVRLPRGVLMEGPPGCGKTLLARAVAGETNARFYFTSASEFVEMFVGVGAARVRDTFDLARKHAPSVVFIDELDAVGRRRGSGLGSSHDEREQTLNQLLDCLDGLGRVESVVVIAATNRPDILDSALLRPGRFDRRIRIPLLSADARCQALRIHTRNKRLAAGVALDSLVSQTESWTGAQLENLCNEAGLLAVRRAVKTGQVPQLEMDDFRNALSRTAEQARIFNRLDAVLIESNTQLAEPTGRAVVRVSFDHDALEGEVVWADAKFLKIRTAAGEVLVPKEQIQQMRAVEGTEPAGRDDVEPDRWANRPAGLA
jgi:cell division protease FtsH